MSGERTEQAINPKARPRVALEDLPVDLDVDLEALFPHTEVMTSSSRLHHSDWDALVTSAPVVKRQGLYVLAIGSSQVRRVVPLKGHVTPEKGKAEGYAEGERYIQGQKGVSGRGLTRVPNLPPTLDRLVREVLAPGFEENWASSLALTVHCVGGPLGSRVEPHPLSYLDPIARSSDGHVIAGRFRMKSESGEVTEGWILPGWIKQPTDWATAAWEIWHGLDHKHFPLPPTRGRSEEWRTPEETRLYEQVADLEERVKKFTSTVEKRLEPLRAHLDAERAKGDAGPRRLITGKDDPLVDAVFEVLTDLGFDVENMDKIHPKGDRREDLRIRFGDYEAIAEVKGTVRGASSSRLLQLGNHATRYAVETQRAPSGRWYIVNPQIDRDPADREEPLCSKPEEVTVFGEGPGIVLWTLDLFKLWRRVVSGQISPENARRLLMDARGRFRLPDDDPSQNDMGLSSNAVAEP